MGAASIAVEVFCSYAHEDETWRKKLETHLSLLRRQGLVSLWHDRLIPPGINWAQNIDQHLETASVVLLLVSADFLDSDYCYGVEMKRALERQEAGEARVVPILVRPVDWKGAPFAHLQALPTDAKPIATSRNKDTALADVAAGIRRVIEDVPLLASSAPRAALPKIWNVPYQRNPFFLGRDAELVQVRQNLQADQTTTLSQPQAISGLGGIGKTQLAVEYAYRYHQDYQMVLWARAESKETLISSYIELARLLWLPEREATERELTVQAVKTWLQTPRNWLLILDNAEELTLLLDFLPPNLGGHLLLTTRTAATGGLAQRMEIEILSPAHSALFLLRRATLIAPDATLEQTSQEERELALQFCQQLGGLPLALDQAGAYIEETGCGLVGYQKVYQQRRMELLKRRGKFSRDHPESVAATWSLSFERVEEKNPASADLLRLCAYLFPDAIAEEILTAGASWLGPLLAPVAADAWLFNQAIETLRAYSLMRRDPKGKTLSIHRLVQAVLQDQLSEAERHTWAERAMFAVNAAFPQAEHDTWPQCERLLMQTAAAMQITERYQVIGEVSGRLLYEAAYYLRDHAHYAEAEPLFLRALAIYEQQLGPEHLLLAYPLNNLASLYSKLGKYVEAEPLFQRALRIKEQWLGPEHPLVAYPLNGLASIYREQGKYVEAELLFLRALHIWEQTLGMHHPKTTETRKRFIALLHTMGQHEQAAQLEAVQSEP